MRVIEIYQSKQGEGLWTGNYSVFLRLLGCSLRCRYCDTAYARFNRFDVDPDVGADLSPDEVVGRVMLLDLPNVVITGGEPMQSPEIVDLTRLLRDCDYVITIETAGIVDKPVLCDLMSISPKMSNSTPLTGDPEKIRRHEEERNRPEVVRELIRRYENHQLKFVVDGPEDLEEVDEYVAELGAVEPGRVLLMPQAVDAETMNRKAEWLVPLCEERGYRYCPRMQIVWYGHKPRT